MSTQIMPLPGTQVAQPSGETASMAVAAQAKATVEARYLVALNRPRSWDEMRLRLLKSCERPGFAETAMYQKPIGGGKITGPSIRFVEEALRHTQNVLVESPVIYDDDEKRIARVLVTDLESNISYTQDIAINKTVERRQVKAGMEVIGSRQNSTGQTVYKVRATEDDLTVKQAALVSKAIRTQGLRLIPGDIVEEAIARIEETVKNRDAKDPEGAKKRLLDAFYAQGVNPRDLEAYIGHSVDGISPAELHNLRVIYTAIKEGETTWVAVMEQKEGARSAGGEGATASPATKGTDGLKAALDKKKPAAATAPSPATPSPAPPTDAGRTCELCGGQDGKHDPSCAYAD